MENYVLIILDSVGYKDFKEANTPVSDSIGKLKKAYSHACWTLPSMLGLFVIPYYIPKLHLYSGEFARPEWKPKELQKKGYFTMLLNGNPWIDYYRKIFTIGFHKYFYTEKIDALINYCLSHLNKEPYFITFLIVETHEFRNKRKAIEEVDRKLEKLFKQLLVNTTVTITADHADSPELHDPGKLSKFYPELFEVPFIQGRIKRNYNA